MKKNYVTVRFFDEVGNLNSKEYSYMTDLELKKGDWVIVEVKDAFKAVMVCSTKGLSKNAINAASKWIVSKIDTDAYMLRKKTQETIAELKYKLRQRKEEAEEFVIYQQLAAIDPEIERLIEELRMLDPGAVPQLPGGGA